MESDVSVKLNKNIQSAFDRNLHNNNKASALLEKINAGNATYADAGNYAEEVGNSLSKALRSEIKADSLPDGKMYWNICEKAIQPLYEQEFNLAANAAQTVQGSLNKKANIGLKAKTAKLDEKALKSIMAMYCAADYTKPNDELYETPKAYARSGVDETLKENADFQWQCGRTPRIVRRAGAKCCDWCAEVEGVYDYPNVPDDVYKRHDNCKCSVDYDPGSSNAKSGSTQSVWSKIWSEMSNETEKEIRKTIGLEDNTVDKEKLKTLNL